MQRYLNSISKAKDTPSNIRLEQNFSKNDSEKAELYNQYVQSAFSQKDYQVQIDQEKDPKSEVPSLLSKWN